MKRNRIIGIMGALALLLGVLVGLAGPASAHVPTITADCDGVHINAVKYSKHDDNRWFVNIGGVTKSGTFDEEYDATFPVPQDGATTGWQASIDVKGSSQYDLSKSGEVGPCGTPPPPPPPPVCNDACKIPPVTDLKNVVCNGSLNDGMYQNVVVKRDKTCVLTDVFVNGNVIARGARNLLIHDATIRGDVIADKVTGDVYLGSKQSCRYDPQVGGSVRITRSHNVLVCDMDICHDLVLRGNNGKITVQKTKARGTVRVSGNRHYRSDGPSVHPRESVIRLIGVHGKKFVIKDNAPRKVQRRA